MIKGATEAKRIDLDNIKKDLKEWKMTLDGLKKTVHFEKFAREVEEERKEIYI